MVSIKTLIETQEFATLPPVAAKILTMLENDDVDIREIAKVIEADASLTLKLLRVANSPLYAARIEVSSVHQAIMKLGLNRLTNIVLGVSIFSKFLLNTNKEASDLMQKFWWHASCTGMIAKALAVKINRFFKENEFIGGLLHDIGKLAMMQYDSSLYMQVVDLVQNNEMIDTDAEMKVYGFTHIQVGREIAKLWKLPDELTTVISYHTSPDEAPNNKELVAAVRIPDLLSEMWGAGFYEGRKSLKLSEEPSWLLLCHYFPDLVDLDLEIFTFELENEFRKSSDFLSLLMQNA